MGIKGLLWYTKTQTTAYYDVDIKELADRKRKEGKEPVIVMDVMNCIRNIYGDLDWICGGQYRENVDNWKRFLNSFREAGVKLIMIIDGSCQEDKRSEWIRRRYEKTEKSIYPTFDALKRNQQPSDRLGQVLPNMNMTLVLTQMLGVELMTSLKEADYEIAKAARDYDAIGILANDSDYLIYQTGVPLLSIPDLDLKTLRTKCYNAGRLAQHLDLKVSQLPLLAILAGNDNVSKDKLMGFHSWLVGAYKRNDVSVLFPTLVQFIKQNKYGGAGYTGQDIINDSGRIAEETFKDSSMTGLLVQTIQDYFLDLPDLKEEEEPFADSNWTQILAMFKKEYVESRVCKLYPIMTKLRYDSSESLEDYRESHRIPPNGLLWESTRFRLYGILLKEHPDNKDKSLEVREYMMTGPESLDSPTYVVPEYPPHHPGLLYLQTDRSAAAKMARYKLFAWCVDPALDYQQLIELDPSELGIVANLYKLQHEREKKVLEDWEVNVFLVQFYLLKNLSLEELKTMPNMLPTPRSAQLATLFTKTPVTFLNFAVGLLVPTPDLLNHSQLDGKLFQTVYARGRGSSVADLLQRFFEDQFDTSVQFKIKKMFNIINA